MKTEPGILRCEWNLKKSRISYLVRREENSRHFICLRAMGAL